MMSQPKGRGGIYDFVDKAKVLKSIMMGEELSIIA